MLCSIEYLEQTEKLINLAAWGLRHLFYEYQLIFMSSFSEAQTFDEIYAHLGSVADECLNVLQKDYDLSKDNAKILFEHVWIHTFGIGALCATGVCDFSREQIAEMLTQDFNAMMMLMQS